MMRSVLSNWDLPILPIIALFIFLTLFILMLFSVFKKQNQKKHNLIESLPFDDGELYEK